MGGNIAVIDLGTNTFHLLIVNQSDSKGTWTEVYRERKYIHLAEDGIETIGPQAYQRAFNALKVFSEICNKYGVKKLKACGTAALRTASNGAEFVESVFAACNIKIEIINGIKEAKLIAKGVQLALPKSDRNRLIMDIGGGSVEFILVKKAKLFWAKSFPIGVAVLKKLFHHSDPVSKRELADLFSFLEVKLVPLKKVLDQETILDLVGASGTFDVLQNMMTKIKVGESYSQLALGEFDNLSGNLIQMNLEQRNSFPNLPIERSELIVVALALIQYVLDIHDFQQLYVSRYAMKEGIISELTES